MTMKYKAGTYEYCGMGLGHYYSIDGTKHWLWRSEAEAMATVEGVELQFVDGYKDI